MACNRKRRTSAAETRALYNCEISLIRATQPMKATMKQSTVPREYSSPIVLPSSLKPEVILLSLAPGKPRISDRGTKERTVRDCIKPEAADPARINADCRGASLINLMGVLSNDFFSHEFAYCL